METSKLNWKNPKDYDFLNDLGPNQWAWEFLRRNQKYKEDWKLFNKKWQSYLVKSPKSKFGGVLITPEFSRFESRLSSKWGLDEMRNPDILYPDRINDPDGIKFLFDGGFDTSLMGLSKREKYFLYWGVPDFETGKISFTFNFHEPLEPQLQIVKKRFQDLQQKAKKKGLSVRTAFKPRINEWKLLLRIFDAKISGIKNKDIAAIFFPDEVSKAEFAKEKRVHDKYLQAKKYINRDYRLIPSNNSEI